MAKSKVEETVVVNLELTKEEAYWLKGLMQNPVCGSHPSEEDHQNHKVRSAIWNALPSFDQLVDMREMQGGY